MGLALAPAPPPRPPHARPPSPNAAPSPGRERAVPPAPAPAAGPPAPSPPPAREAFQSTISSSDMLSFFLSTSQPCGGAPKYTSLLSCRCAPALPAAAPASPPCAPPSPCALCSGTSFCACFGSCVALPPACSGEHVPVAAASCWVVSAPSAAVAPACPSPLPLPRDAESLALPSPRAAALAAPAAPRPLPPNHRLNHAPFSTASCCTGSACHST